MKARLPTNEKERLEALRSYHVLDTEAEGAFDDLVLVASRLCQAPIALISLIDEERQWFKARVGLDAAETPREQAFCAHAILDTTTMIVPDAADDERFRDNPLVTSFPNIRFYAGAPLLTPDGHGLGTLCVIDSEPRTRSPLDPGEVEVLEALSRQAVRLLEYRKVTASLADALEHVKVLSPLVPVCAWCHRVRDDGEFWSTIEAYLHRQAGVTTTHGICPSCAEGLETELKEG
jgi:GAF domain-containing protein